MGTRLFARISRIIERFSQQPYGRQQDQEERLAYASHDLRAPWATVHEAAALLADGVMGTVNEEQRRLLAVILERTESWLQRVDEMVTIPRWVAAGSPLHLQEESMGEVLQQAAGLVKGLVLVRESAMNIVVNPGLPKVMIDRYRIVQAVTALLATVLSSSPRGSQVRLSARLGSDDELEIEVCGLEAASGPNKEGLASTQDAENDRSPIGEKEMGVVRSLVAAHGGRFFPTIPGRATGPYRLTLPCTGVSVAKG